MKKIFIEGDDRNPAINFDSDKGLIEISGRSTIENSTGFYQPLYEWINYYNEAPAKFTTVNIRLEYFNTSTSRWLFKILKKLETTQINTKNVIINWYYIDEDILDAGKDMEAMIDIPFQMLSEPVEEY
ncbi:MAG: DUF1987 domain-containing protein [Bacteroidia bacterium]|nr:DUF1987 domain-containing protein [Bacteroidia bacterium]